MTDIRRAKRVFVNDVDLFSSKHVAQYLSTCLTDVDEVEEGAASGGEAAFQVVGTASSPSKNLSSVFQCYVSPSREELLDRLLECDVILYNISENATMQAIDEATWAVTALHEEMANFKLRKMFILLSSVMTWAMTKPHNPEEPEESLSEEEFRRRRPHPWFRAHYELEKLVLKLARTKKTRLPAYVVSSGLQYGQGENIFHYFFKVSWLMQSPEVPMFGPGTNNIPMIHVHDLAGIIQNLIVNKPKTKYVLAVDESRNTLEEIIQAISDTLGPGKVKELTEQDAIFMKAFEPRELELLKLNLSLEPSLIRNLSLQWVCESGLVENMESIVEEFKETRQLLPVRILLLGPPAVGKTTVAKKLCEFYQLQHIQMQDVIQEKIREEESEDTEELKQISQDIRGDAGLSADRKLLQLLQDKLNSRACLNQGFVLDGFPHTYAQAQQLFDAKAEREESNTMEPVYDKKITPENVFVLDAADDVLTQRLQCVANAATQQQEQQQRHQQEQKEKQQQQVQQWQEQLYTAHTFASQLQTHRRLSTADETLIDYFEELEIYPEHIDVAAGDPENAAVLKMIVELVGEPKNYGPSDVEIQAQRARQEEEERIKLECEYAEKRRKNQATLAEMAAHYEHWRQNLCELQHQQQQLLSAQSLPLRTYLMKFVMPQLSEAMTECTRARPEDPVDFLAEYLLRNSGGDPQEQLYEQPKTEQRNAVPGCCCPGHLHLLLSCGFGDFLNHGLQRLENRLVGSGLLSTKGELRLLHRKILPNDHTNKRLVDDYTNKRPSNCYYTNKKTTNHFTNKRPSNYYYTNKKTTNHFTNKRPSNYYYTNKKTTNHFTNKRPSNYYYTNKKTTNHFTNKRPSLYYTNKRPSLYHTNKRPSNYYTNKGPSNYYTNKRPSNYYTNKRPSNYYTNKRPSNYYTNKRPSNYYTNKRPSNYYTNKKT
uniref:Nucleoside-diphosphate kinase n=1 Tax=Knipowitschia caucasica TaxID=637954 RepID=A0AAV2K4D7_KNICA